MCLCIPRHIHCSCSTVMALLCIPLSELVSFALSTIPIPGMSLLNFSTELAIIPLARWSPDLSPLHSQHRPGRYNRALVCIYMDIACYL